jgi:hypothetical protein
MLVIAVAGIRLTARTQIALAVVEYTILVGLAIALFVFVASTIRAPCTSAGRGCIRPGSEAGAASPTRSSSRRS